MSTVGKTLDNFEDSWRMLKNSNLWMFATPLDPWRILKKRADNHAVTERSDVKSSRLRLPSESWAEENLLPWELFYWRRPNTALERRQRNTSVQLSGCTKMHQVSYQVSLWRRGIPTGRCRGQCLRLRLWECLPTLPCTASITQPGKLSS